MKYIVIHSNKNVCRIILATNDLNEARKALEANSRYYIQYSRQAIAAINQDTQDKACSDSQPIKLANDHGIESALIDNVVNFLIPCSDGSYISDPVKTVDDAWLALGY